MTNRKCLLGLEETAYNEGSFRDWRTLDRYAAISRASSGSTAAVLLEWRSTRAPAGAQKAVELGAVQLVSDVVPTGSYRAGTRLRRTKQWWVGPRGRGGTVPRWPLLHLIFFGKANLGGGLLSVRCGLNAGG